ncbi:unnamed protein product [Cylindrotheca closterium]|uniref:Plastid lipid-associated protein/fibrillin conserved domain-containing protein n=1 Tax=Cylindrotheca closterium TaxID=2856 RepID=A0AAD2CS08_9STRA|nr:unnamed protein product [Cylindrotheca closterium]
MRSNLLLVLFLCGLQTAEALQNLQLPKVFQMFQSKEAGVIQTDQTTSRVDLEKELIRSISNTEYGKSASLSNQIEVLNRVSQLESEFPAPPLQNILEDGSIDGTWYLQYTAPSEIEADGIDGDKLKSSWEVKDAEENITTKRFEAKGSVSAGGIDVDVSNKPPKQIFDLSQNSVYNEVVLPKAFVRVGGSFRLSENNEKRAIVSFNQCTIDLNFIKLDLGFLFGVIGFFKGTTENGWLETTYLSDNVRIGRGNKGSMFVLTRDEGSVAP